MVGIDVVDLKDPLLKPRGQRALRLILHPEDQIEKLDNLFWLLWTAKESVFKCKRKVEPFAPQSIPIQIISNKEQLTFRSAEFNGEFIIKEEYIAAVAARNNISTTHYIWKTRTKNPSDEVRNKLIELKAPNGEFIVETDSSGLPSISSTQSPISFTHHRNYCGFAILGN
ncbi:MAG: 4-phosphopantetheinyl transferase family protein [Cyclobacteriaceae bacterium]